ncbi:hypothetical protein [Candidatus Uabimicrobium sp. HlEnr_7]|uniref:hypothetical protein n=1 Tax=Candidatus Uabimicrobium helgolandensis TaxID=3095367 RepID=UPI003556C605
MQESKSSKNNEGIYEPFSIEDIPWTIGENKKEDVYVYPKDKTIQVKGQKTTFKISN